LAEVGLPAPLLGPAQAALFTATSDTGLIAAIERGE
jgi:hypothetical protein